MTREQAAELKIGQKVVNSKYADWGIGEIQSIGVNTGNIVIWWLPRLHLQMLSLDYRFTNRWKESYRAPYDMEDIELYKET